MTQQLSLRPAPADASTPIDRASPTNDVMPALRVVAAELDIVLDEPPERAVSGSPQEQLAHIAAFARLRTRQVILKGEWWRGDHGPLLGFRADTAAVALLPRGARGYTVVEPLTGRRAAVTADSAAELASFAVMLYRPLPEYPLRALDLLRWALLGSRGAVLALLATLVFAGLLSLAVPLAAWLIFDQLVPAGRTTEFLLLGLALILAALASAALETLRAWLLLRLRRGGTLLQAATWDRLLRLPPPFFRQYLGGDLGDRVLSVDDLWRGTADSAARLLLALVVVVVSWAVLLAASAPVAWVAVLVVVGVVGMTLLLNAAQLRCQRAHDQLGGAVAGLLLQCLRGIARFRVAGAEARVLATWADLSRSQQAASDRLTRLRGAQAAFSAAAPILAAALAYAVLAARGTPLSLGAVLAVLIAFAQLLIATQSLLATLVGVAGLRSIYARVRPLFAAVPEASAVRADPGELQGAIELDQVSFRYAPDGPRILDDVSLAIRPGEFVALVGPSGSGKSTLLRLLLGFEAPERGAVRYDGRDLSTLDLGAVRRQLGVVLQNGTLLPDDLFHNIVGSALLNVDEAWAAARMVGLADEIERLPMGMHTLVSEGGATFSGGQRQRLLIARAIVRRPRIVFLDEATSALDNLSQAVVTASLERLRATRVVVAHRLSTVVHADRIVVLRDGKVVESGTYAQLMQHGGLFAELARRQLD